MNALIRKEFRLLLPAFAAAFVLVAVSGCLGTPAFPTGTAVWLGTALIGISCFGREFHSNTFSLLLTLPIPRQKIWWIKIGALLMLLCVLWLERIGMRLIFGFEAWSDWASVVCVPLATLGGALWTTLLLRESLAAFCVALLLPVSIFAVEDMAKVPAGIIFASLALYGAAGPVFAWRLFQRAQDVGWTGGEVAVRLAPFAGWKTRAARRTFHPFGALFRKEAKLHQPACLMILGLLVLHFAAILARTAMRSDQNSLAGETLSVFSGFWLIVPLAVGAVGIAEERKLGTLQQATTLPFRRNIQFGLKLLFPVFLGGLLSPLLVVVAEGIATTIGAPARIPLFDPAFSLHALGWLILVFSGLSLAGVYASSLSSSFVQALTLGVGISGIVYLSSAMLRPASMWRWAAFSLWAGPLMNYLYWPALAIAILVLVARNWSIGALRPAHQWKNFLCLATVILAVIITTPAVYYRSWEFLFPPEPVHGAARISASGRVLMRGDSEGFGALLPDGKAWAGEFYYQRGTPMFNNYKGPALDLGGKWIRGQNGAQPGRDWKDFALIDWFVFGIRSNGTLWVSEKASPWNQPQRLTNSLRQVGGDTDWQAVAVASYPAVLLKTDGTLWRWGEPAYTKLDRSHPFASAPALLPFGSDWRKVIPGESGDSTAYAWKNDGSAWLLGFERSKGGHCTMEPLRAFDGLEWKERPATLTFLFDRGLLRRFQIGVRSDGSLWWWEGSSSGKASTEVKDLRQIGTDTNWVSVLHGGRDFILVGLKTDGTLWKWSPFKFRRGYASFAPDIPPKRLGRNNDWLAIHQSYQGVFALAADGTLWFWWERDGPQPLLAPPRRPVFLASIFSGAK